jgi:hypothetical protein
MFDEVLAGVVRNLADHGLLAWPVVDVIEADIFGVAGGDAQSLNDEPGADGFERAFDQSIDHVHERKLNGLAILEQGHRMELHVDALLHAFDDAGVEVAEELTAQGG